MKKYEYCMFHITVGGHYVKFSQMHVSLSNSENLDFPPNIVIFRNKSPYSRLGSDGDADRRHTCVCLEDSSYIERILLSYSLSLVVETLCVEFNLSLHRFKMKFMQNVNT